MEEAVLLGVEEDSVPSVPALLAAIEEAEVAPVDAAGTVASLMEGEAVGHLYRRSTMAVLGQPRQKLARAAAGLPVSLPPRSHGPLAAPVAAADVMAPAGRSPEASSMLLPLSLLRAVRQLGASSSLWQGGFGLCTCRLMVMVVKNSRCNIKMWVPSMYIPS